MGAANDYGSMLSGSVRSLRLSALRSSADCFFSLQQWHCGWLTLLLSVIRFGGLWCWLLSGQWSRVGNACGLWFIRLLGRVLLYSRPFQKLPLPSGLMMMMILHQVRHGRQVLFCLASKDVHCIPLGNGGIVFRNLHALLRTFQVSSSTAENLSYRLRVHAISFSHSIYLMCRRLESCTARKGTG
jgi:hypothetical protein